MTSTQTPERLSDEAFRELASGVGMGPRGERLYADHLRARAVESSQAEEIAKLREDVAEREKALAWARDALARYAVEISRLGGRLPDITPTPSSKEGGAHE